MRTVVSSDPDVVVLHHRHGCSRGVVFNHPVHGVLLASIKVDGVDDHGAPRFGGVHVDRTETEASS